MLGSEAVVGDEGLGLVLDRSVACEVPVRVGRHEGERPSVDPDQQRSRAIALLVPGDQHLKSRPMGAVVVDPYWVGQNLARIAGQFALVRQVERGCVSALLAELAPQFRGFRTRQRFALF